MRLRLRLLPLLLLAVSANVSAVEIWEVQGRGATSPFAGQRVELRGSVVTMNTAIATFIQTPAARSDNDPETSDGIAVAVPFRMWPDGSTPGAVVDVIGVVEERNGATWIQPSSVTLTGERMPVPEPVRIEPGRSDFERLEGMLASLAGVVAEPPTDRKVRVVAGSKRPFREPGEHWDQNPEILLLHTFAGEIIDPFCCYWDFIAGATFETLGTIHQDGTPYQFVVPGHTAPTFVNPLYPRPARGRRAGEMSVATQNLYQFFDHRDDPSINETVPTAAAYQDRLVNTSRLIRETLGAPDLLVVQEVESQEALQDVAHQIRDDDPSLVYTAWSLPGNDVGGIDIGFLVRDTIRVDSVEQFGKDERWTPPSSSSSQLLHDRPPLVLRGAYVANGAPFPFVAVGVHLRSLSNIETAFAQAKRHQGALTLSRYLQSLQDAQPRVRLIVAGDFNAHEFSDGYVDVMGQITGRPDRSVPTAIPATDEVNPDLVDWVLSLPQHERYSYIFRGNGQVLDHILTSASLEPFVRGFEFPRVNADSRGSYFKSAAPFGLSDHEPAVLFLMTDANGDGKPDDIGATSGPRRRSTRR